MSGRFGMLTARKSRLHTARLGLDEASIDYLDRGNATEKRRSTEGGGGFLGAQGEGRPKFSTPVSAKDASAGVGLDFRYDAMDPKPWCVVKWPGGEEKRFETKTEALDYIKSIDEKEFWDEGKGAARDRDRVGEKSGKTKEK